MARFQRKGAVLTPSECDLLDASGEDANLFFGYFFSPDRGKTLGWQLDHNFAPEANRFQFRICHAQQSRIVLVGGFGASKSTLVGMIHAFYACKYNYYDGLNCAPTMARAKDMYDKILMEATGTRFEDLIVHTKDSPYPEIHIRFQYRGIWIQSKISFMSVKDNANNILGWEGDFASVDEAGRVDDLETLRRNLGSRVRGQVKGRSRLGRIIYMSNAWDEPQFWMMYDMALDDPEGYLSLTVDTRWNLNITEEQLRFIIKDIPEEDREQFLAGKRPEGKGKDFSQDKVIACQSEFMDEEIIHGVRNGLKGYALSRKRGAGVVRLTMPRKDGRTYLTIGDLGVSNAPFRNSPAIFSFDITYFPNEPADMVSFWWGDGEGKIDPFIRELIAQVVKFRPMFVGVDNTGPQKGTVQVLNTMLQSDILVADEARRWERYGVKTELVRQIPAKFKIHGMNFGGGNKAMYLFAAKTIIGSELMRWPKLLTGLRTQLLNYDAEKDRGTTGKIAQDLVATLCMAARMLGLLLQMGGINGTDSEDEDSRQADAALVNTIRSTRLARGERSQRNSRPTGRRKVALR